MLPRGVKTERAGSIQSDLVYFADFERIYFADLFPIPERNLYGKNLFQKFFPIKEFLNFLTLFLPIFGRFLAKSC